MRNHILYAYVEGSNHTSVSDAVITRFSDLVNGHNWISGEVWTVNQKRNGSWELGLNLELPDPGSEPDGWFSDIEEIAITCGELARTHCLTFIVGISDNNTKIADDLFHINEGMINIEMLKSIIGVSS